jgi:hypothetical protein
MLDKTEHQNSFHPVTENPANLKEITWFCTIVRANRGFSFVH